MIETGSHTRKSSVEKSRRSLTLGLVTAPEIPEKLANELAPELPDLLREHIDDHVSWEVEVAATRSPAATRASLIFVPGNLLQSSLGHPAGPLVYAAIAWVTASVATIAGALGGSLDDTARVREAAFGYRQRRRAEERQKPEKPSTTSRTR